MLQIGCVDHRLRAPQEADRDVGHEADDFAGTLVGAEIEDEPLADRIFTRPKALGRRFVYDCRPRRGSGIAGGEFVLEDEAPAFWLVEDEEGFCWG